jgi:hypothetical protein
VCGLEGDVITTNDIAIFNYDHEDKDRIVGHYTSLQAVPKFLPRIALMSAFKRHEHKFSSPACAVVRTGDEVVQGRRRACWTSVDML